MEIELYDYHSQFAPLYAKQFPERVYRMQRRSKCGIVVKKWFGEHFRQWMDAKIWEVHKEDLIIRHWKKLLQSAQDSRFRDKVRAQERKQREERNKAKQLARECRERVWAEKRAKRQADLDLWAFNMELNKKRKLAYEEKAQWIEEWKERHKDVLRSREASKRAEKRRKQILKERTSEKGVWALIQRIQRESCYCYWCQIFLPDGGEADHVVPINKGGTNSLHNIVPSCPKCNSVKRDIMPNDPSFPVSQQLQIPLVG